MEKMDWDKRYREGFYDGADEAHDLLQRFWRIIPPGPVVDVAMGRGKNTVFLAKKGFRVYGIDSSREAIKMAREAMTRKGRNTLLILGDAGNLPFKADSMAGVIVFYFLLRNIMKVLIDLLQQGGIIIYETFLKRQNLLGRHRNPDFLLNDGELISFFNNFDLIFYEETMFEREGKKRAVAQFVGRKR